MSLRARLVVAVCVASLIALGTAGLATFTLYKQSQVRQIDDALQRTHEPLEELVSADDGSGVGGSQDATRSIEQLAPGQLVVVLGADGTVQISVPARQPGHEALMIDAGELREPPASAGTARDVPSYDTVTADDGETPVRVRVSRLSDGRVLVLGLSMHEAVESAQRLIVIETVVAAVSLLIAGLLGWLLVQFGLRPLREVEQTALEIASGGDLEREVPGARNDTEVGHLAAALNTMLSRIRDAFAERDAKERDLEMSEAKMRRFVADVSHELRTPLSAVVAYAELFERGARDRPEDLERALRGIGVEAGRMSELVEELLLLARLDEGRPLDRGRVDLVEVVVDAVAAARAVSPDWPVTLRVAEVVVVDGDASRLRQVVDNLLANVRTHTPIGTSTAVEVGVDGDDAVVIITDNGPGLTASDASRVFERFFRADPSRSRGSGGAGLGLAIVEALVTAHGGNISLDTSPGNGVRVIVKVPLATGDEPTQATQATQATFSVVPEEGD